MFDLVLNQVQFIELMIILVQSMQIPLVLFISILCFKSINILNKNELIWISLGFAINFIYIMFSVLNTNIFEQYTANVLSKHNQSTISNILDILNSFCFYMASARWLSIKAKIMFSKYIHINFRILTNSIIVLITAIILLFALDLNSKSTIPFGNIPIIIYDFCSLLLILLYFKNNKNKQISNNYFNIGFLSWASLQLLLLIPFSYVDENFILLVGFSISLFAKIMILFGLFYSYVDTIDKTARSFEKEKQEKEQFLKSSDYFENLLLRTFHEIDMPIKAVDTGLFELGSIINRELYRGEFVRIENNFERVKAIVSIAKDSYNKEIPYDINAIPVPSVTKAMKIVSLNNLVEIAIRTFKSSYSKITFDAEYRAGCFIECSQYEIVQVLLNLFKNAYEAYDIKSQKIIAIRTFIDHENSNNNGKTVVAEIEDYASGISPEIKNNIWNPGYSTKTVDEKNIVRGQGLYITKVIMNKHGNSDILVESPIIRKDGSIVHGTKFSLIFK
jgi:signal transduction histidine kinase